MVLEFFWFAVGLLITLSIVAIGAYVGTLRALDTFHGDGGSVFLSEKFNGRHER